MADPRLTVALDARLLGSRNTGDTAYWRGLVGGLAQLGSDVDFLLVSNGPAPLGVPEGPNFRWVEASARFSRWWSLVRFPLVARKAGARVLHTQYTLSPLGGRCGVTTVHDVSFFVGPEWFRPRDRWLLQRTVPASCRRAAAVLTVSETSKAEIERHVPAARGKVTVTPNALGENIRPMPGAEAQQIVRTIGAPDRYVLTVGTRWPRKNMPLAIETARLVGIPIVVTGQPGWGEEPPGAFQTGYVDDRTLTALYQNASLYLAPACHEGFGIPLLEAFACGCPVVCSSGGALPEVAGGAAEVVSDFRAETWAQAVRSLLADSGKLEELRRRGRSRVGDFDWRRTAEATLAVYRQASR